MRKFFNWLHSLFKSEKNTEIAVITEPTDEVIEEKNDEELDIPVEETIETECHCEECNCDKQSDEDFLKNLDWDNLDLYDLHTLYSLDLENYCDDLVNWYKISKIKGLPDDFIRKYKDKIIWKEYNKSYLRHKTRDMLREEGYL